MEPAKARFLFGDVPEGYDLDDPETRSLLVSQEDDLIKPEDLGLPPENKAAAQLEMAVAVREIVTHQIAVDDPPEVWATAQRLTAQGLTRQQALVQLVLALGSRLVRPLEGGGLLDGEAYVESLNALPLPVPEDIAEMVLHVVRERQPLYDDEALKEAARLLGYSGPDETFWHLADRVSESLMDEEMLSYLPGDLLVSPPDLLDDVVLTHRLSREEHESGILRIDPDLAPFRTIPFPQLMGGERLRWTPIGATGEGWKGPPGWLDEFEPEGLLAVWAASGAVIIAGVDSPPDDPELVDRLRAAYEAEIAEPQMPAAVSNIVLALLAEDRTTFLHPRLPLGQLCAAAGLEVQAHFVAHDTQLWRNARNLSQAARIYSQLGEKEQRDAALSVLTKWDDPDSPAGDLREALSGMEDPIVLSAVVDAIAPPDDDTDEGLEDLARFAADALRAARTPRQKAIARLVAAIAEERHGKPLIAQQHLEIAVEEDQRWPPVVDRAAWYAFDRGDAPRALGLWGSLGSLAPPWVQELEPFAGAEVVDLGRNQPCWCGSGRKYKHCHLGRPVQRALPERVGWICRKATCYLERVGGHAMGLMEDLAFVRNDGRDPEDDGLPEDPLVADCALVEGGLFEAFITDRGPLLPEDEALLARSWTLVPRTVYEVLDVRPGQELTVSDLRTGDAVVVRERTFSRSAKKGMVVCARAVPDGEGHQFIGAVFSVPAGKEAEVLEICDGGDPHDLCAFVAALERPPALTTREGEPMTECRAELRVADPAAGRAVLDELYQYQYGSWVEKLELAKGDNIVRAHIQMNGSTITVDTLSEPRMDRVLEVLDKRMRYDVISDVRNPVRLERRPDGSLAALGASALPGLPPGMEGPSNLPPEQFGEVMSQIQQMMEDRWLDEPVPALDRLTPREAAADPTRRRQLERLIAGFPDQTGVPSGVAALRPDRLRQQLGL